ncbi:hypothetical protein T11_3660 [Trichinella zimbabwensis]|uniref:Uncharacterized protein n=1 Tax=Trichinella zimbabwensis TaxID=268475 RepID=A0A0V1GRY7_9BILA|nr:hypothetical protein T11_17264 [Trichinella zimbabwensis]KRZ01102.1 hypothetical protein T11_3660 [Trichinella zimbabwensis]
MKENDMSKVAKVKTTLTEAFTGVVQQRNPLSLHLLKFAQVILQFKSFLDQFETLESLEGIVSTTSRSSST